MSISIHTFAFCSSLWLLEMETLVTADEVEQLCHLQGDVWTKQLFSVVWGDDTTQTAARCSRHDPDRIHLPPVETNTPPERGNNAPSWPYGGDPYKELAACQPSCPLRDQLSHMGQLLAKKSLTGVHFSVYHRKVQLPQACYAIMWSNQKCWWLRGLLLFIFFLMRWLSALNASAAPGFSG